MGNVERRAVAPKVVAGIVRQHGITRDTFRVLDSLVEINDPDGKSYFLLSNRTGGGDARDAALLTYLLNAGTGYGPAGNDFPETPYGADEVRRIIGRQRANRWSYDAVRVITGTGGCLAATPNGVLMGLGGNWIHTQLSRRGGTMWGDVFLLNGGRGVDPTRGLRAVIEAGCLADGGPSLDRVLHHEERHAQQWARLGPVRMGTSYLAEETRVRILGGDNRFEVDAGLSDGGYR
ncbi:hypothetical protein KIH27_07440 [Mycobacterium sp. M1]|uniref:Uncharacterized protein n=1 Tax=Mycolicibacter acidiphilus TaxID=2835306 RepID=A0ABS5RIM5_9MYCO|nr:hypothetical protein [Mycolicibacter acidiphilus]MBS9533423.1 hypothetical protein [Mycolicibacter acidiphilus]